MELYRSLLENAIYYLFPVSLLESFFLYRKGRADIRESLTNLSSNVLGRIIRITLTGGVLLAVLAFAKNYSFHTLPVNGWMFAGTLLFTDFIYYWKHRLSHEIRLLWSYHSVHHSSWQFNLSTALRLPWFGSFLDSLFYIPAVLVGFDPILLIIGKGTVLLFQYPIHTEMVGKLGYWTKYSIPPPITGFITERTLNTWTKTTEEY